MMKAWNQLSERVAKMSLRERGIVFVAVLALLYVLFDTVALAPLGVRKKAAVAQLNQSQTELQVLGVQLDVLSRGKSADPDAANKAKLEDLRRKIAAFETEAKEQSAQLISAQRMRSVLQELLASRPGLELVELKTLPESTLDLSPPQKGAAAGAKPEASASGEAGTIYKHGVQVKVRGSYLELLGYLKQIETLPVRVYWDNLQISVVAHPVLALEFTIYTISLDKAWMQV